MLPRRKFAKNAPPAAGGTVTYFSYEQSLAAHRRARPRARWVVLALVTGFALAGLYWASNPSRDGVGSYIFLRLIEIGCFTAGALLMAPAFAALSGANMVTIARGQSRPSEPTNSSGQSSPSNGQYSSSSRR